MFYTSSIQWNSLLENQIDVEELIYSPVNEVSKLYLNSAYSKGARNFDKKRNEWEEDVREVLKEDGNNSLSD